MTIERDPEHDGDPVVDLDPAGHIGHEPERVSESIPGGVGERDVPASASDSQPGAPGEPAADAGDTSDVVDGPVGSASLKEPAEAAESSADLDALPSIDV